MSHDLRIGQRISRPYGYKFGARLVSLGKKLGKLIMLFLFYNSILAAEGKGTPGLEKKESPRGRFTNRPLTVRRTLGYFR